MSKLTILSLIAALGLMGFAANFSDPNESKVIAIPPAKESLEVKWYTWNEAMELSKKKPKKMMIDIYTDWCGWCKRMDKSTFSDEKVAAYLNENFYPIKLNAEQRESIVFAQDTFKFVENGGRGVHTLAYALLDGKMGYPSVVYLDEKYSRIMISPGYKETDDMMKELRFASEEHYSKTTWEEYRDKGK